MHGLKYIYVFKNLCKKNCLMFTTIEKISVNIHVGKNNIKLFNITCILYITILHVETYQGYIGHSILFECILKTMFLKNSVFSHEKISTSICKLLGEFRGVFWVKLDLVNITDSVSKACFLLFVKLLEEFPVVNIEDIF